MKKKKKKISPIFSEIKHQVGKLITEINKNQMKSNLRYYEYVEKRLLSFGLDTYYAKTTGLFSKLLKKHGFKYLGNGATRIAILYKDNYVIKIDREGASESQGNREEYRNYKSMIKLDPMMEYCLLPILRAFSFNRQYFVVSPFIKTFNDCFKRGYNLKNGYNGNKKIILKTSYNKKKYKFLLDIFGDTHDDNFGYYKGQIFFIDFDGECRQPMLDSSYRFNTLDLKKNLQIIKKMKSLAS